MITLTRRYRFSASHRLHSNALSAEENAALYGKCNHPYGHGHNYSLEVTVEGEPDARTGVLLPLSRLDSAVDRHVLQLFASRNINLDVPQFAELVPTTENIAAVITQLLEEVWEDSIGGDIALRRIYVRETGRNSFEILLSRPATSQMEEALVHAESENV